VWEKVSGDREGEGERGRQRETGRERERETEKERGRAHDIKSLRLKKREVWIEVGV